MLSRKIRLNVLGVAVGAVLALSIVAVVEGMFYAFNERRERTLSIEQEWSANLFRVDSDVGLSSSPNSDVVHSVTAMGEKLYTAHYTTDALGRRRVPGQEPFEGRDRHLVFFGGSFTFGVSVSDDETLPYYVSGFAPEYRVYNYAFTGQGIQHMLAKLEAGTLGAEIGEEGGIFLFVFIPAHVGRAIGSMRVSTGWGKGFPYYRLGSEGRPVRVGSFERDRPVKQRFYGLLAKEQILKFYEADFPLWLSRGHIELSCALLAESKRLILEQFPHSTFYVVLFPEYPDHPGNAALDMNTFKEYLRKSGVEYLDYGALIDMGDSRFHVKIDRHPTAEAHRLIAEAIAKDLKVTPQSP